MRFYFALCSVLLSLFIGLSCFAPQNSTAQKAASNLSPLSSETSNSLQATVPPAQDFLETKDWLTYRDASERFEFKYPPNFKVERKDDFVKLFHQIKFKHRSPCQPQINADGEEDEFEGEKLDYLVDFDVSFRIVDGGIKDAYLAEDYDENYAAKIAEQLISEYEKVEILRPDQSLNAKNLKIYSGDAPTSCSNYTYAIPLTPRETLLVKRVFITLLNVSATYYLDVPVSERYRKRLKKEKDLIEPEQEKQVFYTVLSTWQKLK